MFVSEQLFLVPLVTRLRTANYIFRESLAFEMMTSLRDKFRNTPDSSKLSLSHVDLLLQSGQNTNAQQLVEDIITGEQKLS